MQVGIASIGLLSGCALAPGLFGSRRAVRVGVLSPANGSVVESLRPALRDLGYAEGANLTLETRSFGGSTGDIATLATEVLTLQPDVIVAVGNAAAVALHDRSRTVPIVLWASTDPVQAGLAESMRRPGGNVTGLSSVTAQLSGKRLELLKAANPALQRVAVLWNESNVSQLDQWEETERAAATIGVEIQSLGVRGPNDLEAAWEHARGSRVEALDIFQDFLTISIRQSIVDGALVLRLPSINEQSAWARAGCLMSYGPSGTGQAKQCAAFIARILKGENPGELPIQQPAELDFVINLATAKAMGIAVPPTLLSEATELIQ